MNIKLNGEDKEVDVNNITGLIAALKLETRMLAVELNLEVVPRSAYATTALKEGDRVEIVHMIGGG